MSMKTFAPCMRLAALSCAALMIGCGGTESNSPDGAGAAGAAARGAAERAAETEAGARDPVAETRPADAGAQAPDAPPTVLFIGTSLTAGRGLPESEAFPALIEQKIRRAGLSFRVVNAGVSGETSAGALSRIDWLLRQPFDVAVIETGANDMLRGVDPNATERNIQQLIDRIREANPDAEIVLAGMLSLPNMGEAYAREFEAIYPRLAEENDVAFVPFLLEGVGGERALNQSDGVHPNAEGHEVIAETVWQVLEPVLGEIAH